MNNLLLSPSRSGTEVQPILYYIVLYISVDILAINKLTII